jgi:hypothetical protein
MERGFDQLDTRLARIEERNESHGERITRLEERRTA